MKNEQLKKYLYIGVTALGVIGVSITFFFLLYKMGAIFDAIKSIISILMPIVYGIALAYLLLPLYNWLNGKFFVSFPKKFKSRSKAIKTAKALSTSICIIFAMVVIIGLFALVVPQVWNSIMSVINKLPQTFEDLKGWINKNVDTNVVLRNFLNEAIQSATDSIKNFINSENLSSILSNVFSGIKSVLAFIENIVVGVIVAIYVLNSAKSFSAQAKKLTYSIFKVKTANAIIHNFRYTHQMVSGFINGRIFESLIVGVLCFIGMSIFGMPYAVLVSAVVGVTNIIPFFGPFIGAIPSTILIFTVSPQQALWFVVFITVLQQFDGNILGPKISSNLTGLSSFWVMFALLLFGGLFGIFGMLLGVPLFAVIKTIISEIVNKLLKKKKMPISTSVYYSTGFVEQIPGDELDSYYNQNTPVAPDSDSNSRNVPTGIFSKSKEMMKKIVKKFTRK